MRHDTLYRVPAAALQEPALKDAAIEAKVEAGKMPLNGGITTDDQGNVFMTDIEHSAILKTSPDAKLSTVVKDKRIRRADGLSFQPDR